MFLKDKGAMIVEETERNRGRAESLLHGQSVHGEHSPGHSFALCHFFVTKISLCYAIMVLLC